MKQTCPICKEIILIDENLYQDGENIDIECPVCGNKVVFTIHHEKAQQKETPKSGNPNLTKCPECGNMVSKKAEKCPHCGVSLAYGKLQEQTEHPQSKSHTEKTLVNNSKPIRGKSSEVRKTNNTGAWIGLGLVAITIITIVVIAVLSNNKSTGGTTPMDATNAYYELLKKGDFKGAVQSTYDYNKEMTKDEKETMDAMLDMTASKIQSSMDEKGGMKNFIVSTSRTNGEEAEVGVTIFYGNGELEDKTEYLIKVKDKWFVK